MKRAFDPLDYPGNLSLYEIESRAAEAVLAERKKVTKDIITIRVRVIPVDALPPELKKQSPRSRPRRP
jgi:hypothetical protein